MSNLLSQLSGICSGVCMSSPFFNVSIRTQIGIAVISCAAGILLLLLSFHVRQLEEGTTR